MIKDTDYAWAAGFWDGEGNVSLTYRTYGKGNPVPRIVIQVAQVDRRVLDRFTEIMGYGKVNGPYEPKTENSNPYYCWRLEGVPHLHDFKEKLEPYLGESKMEQIEKALTARAQWEDTAVCAEGHRLSQSKAGHWRCFRCQSEQATKNATARWAKEKGKVI